MKIRFLGTGTSRGIPEIGCKCDVCQSTNSKDKRLRSSVLIEVDGLRILIDCGPDFREQMLKQDYKKIDAVLLTHKHYDHIGGLDDLRPFGEFGPIDIYSDSKTINNLLDKMSYCFLNNNDPGIPHFIPHIVSMDCPFDISNLKIQAINILHYRYPILGYRINNFAYLTDVKIIPEESFAYLDDLDILVLDALRIQEHISHQSLDEALSIVKRIKPKQTFFIHMSHEMGLSSVVEKTLPQGVQFSYDGLIIEI